MQPEADAPPLPPTPLPLTGEEREVEDLHGILETLGFPPSGDPWMVLEMVLYGQDEELAERARAALDGVPTSPSIRYFRIRFYEHRGDFEAVRSLSRGLVYDEEVASYWEGKLKLKGLESRIMVEGPAAKERSSGAKLEALRSDIAAFERRLRGADEVPLRVLRVELWDRLARRLLGRPRVIYPALEFAEVQLFEVIEELPNQRGYLRAMMHLLANRFAGHMGDLPRVDALAVRFEDLALEPVVEIPEVRRYWTYRFREDGLKLREPVPVALFSRPLRGKAPSGWLPWPADLPGTWEMPGAPIPAVVPDQPVRAPIRLDPLDGGDAQQDYFLRENRARVSGLELEAHPLWIEEHLDPGKIEAGLPVATSALAWPRLALALEPVLLNTGQRDLLREVLDETDRRNRTGPGDVPSRRRWYRGSWSRLTSARVLLAFELGDTDAALSIARKYLAGAAALPAPWTRSEVAGVAEIRGILESSLNPDGACAGSIAELRRLSFLLADGPTVPASGEVPDSIQRLQDVLMWIRAASRCGAASGDLIPFVDNLVTAVKEFDRSQPGQLPKSVLLELRDFAMFLRYPLPSPSSHGDDECRARGLDDLPRPFSASSLGLEAERARLLERLVSSGL